MAHSVTGLRERDRKQKRLVNACMYMTIDAILQRLSSYSDACTIVFHHTLLLVVVFALFIFCSLCSFIYFFPSSYSLS